MAKNGCSKFFPTIFPKKMGRNSDCPKLGIPKFIQTFLVFKEWKKFGMAKTGTGAMGIANC